jgi:hypothetical protein
MNHPIPDAALDDRLGFVGMTGSGKTFGAGTCVERILAKRGRVIIPDPLGVWWGLRQMADGKTPSPYEIAIFGGPHADLPLTPHAGALIGETVAGMRESAIIDLSQFETAASERRFMLGFLDALYRRATGEPVHLIFDEAELWAPERIVDKEGEATKLHGMMQSVVRRGRIKGLTSWLISQRPAALSKNVLSQVDGLVAFRLTASQDRKALGAWIEGQADRDAGKAILGRLPEKRQGEAVVWLPQRGILEDLTFPLKQTYDSSRAPKRGEKRQQVGLRPLDLGKLKDRLSTVEAEVKANDPKALKAEIAQLRRQMQEAAAAAAKLGQTPDPKAIEAADKAGYERGVSDCRGRMVPTFAELENAWARQQAAVGGLTDALAKVLDIAHVELGYRAPPPARPAPRAAPSLAPRTPSHAKPAATNGHASDGTKLAKAERLALTALAQYPRGRSKNQVAILTGYAVNGGGFNNALSALRTNGFLTGSGDNLEITQEGLAALGPYDPLPSGQALLDHWMRQLGKAEREVLRALVEAWPNPMAKEDVAADAGYAADGGGFNNALSRLRTLELVSGRGGLKASDDLFEGAA